MNTGIPYQTPVRAIRAIAYREPEFLPAEGPNASLVAIRLVATRPRMQRRREFFLFVVYNDGALCAKRRPSGGSAFRHSRAPVCPGCFPHRGALARARDWREHGDLLAGEQPDAAHVAGGRA